MEAVLPSPLLHVLNYKRNLKCPLSVSRLRTQLLSGSITLILIQPTPDSFSRNLFDVLQLLQPR
jgi:hypothetical protein